MCKSWCQPFNIIILISRGMVVGSSFGSELFCFCLFVCFSTPKVGDYFVFKSHRWVRFCVCVGVCVFLFVCFVCLFCFLCCFSFKMFNFPTIISRVRLIFFFFFCLAGWLSFLLSFISVCLFFILFCFVLFCLLLPKIPPPLDIKWCALILILLHRWWWTLRHQQFWIPVHMLLFPNALCCSLYERNCVCAVTKIFTKFLPANKFCQLLRVTHKRSCTSTGNAQAQLHFWDDQQRAFGISNISNSVKNLIPIWNFTNTLIQECKIIWEFQIRWGGTSLLRPLWRSWRPYSLMSNRGRFKNFKNCRAGR